MQTEWKCKIVNAELY